MLNVYDGDNNEGMDILHDVADVHLPYYIIFRTVEINPSLAQTKQHTLVALFVFFCFKVSLKCSMHLNAP